VNLDELPRRIVRRPAIALAALLATVLASPAVFSGEVLDDLFHRALLRPEGPVPGTAGEHGVFGFLDDELARRRALLDRGVFPWWTGAATRVAFLRPIAELTHRLDYLLWPGSPAAMHLHTLAWAFALVCAAGLLYRRLLGGRAALLATFLFAVDDAHGAAAGWNANRNAVLAALFGVLALLEHDRARRAGVRGAYLTAPALALASLLSAEAGVATIAYVASYALFLDRGSPRGRALSVAPYVALAAGVRVVAGALGYGARSSGLYVDPVADPARWAGAFLERGPTILAGQWGPVPSDLFALASSEERRVGAVVATALVLLVAWGLAPIVRTDPAARFFAAGMLGSVAPASAALPADRLLLFVGLGAMGLLGRALPVILAARGPRRTLGVALACTHLVLAPLLFPVRAYAVRWFAGLLEPCLTVPDGSRDVVMVNALEVCPAYCPIRAALDGRPAPPGVRTLAGGSDHVELERTGPRSVRVAREGGWFRTAPEQMFWDPHEDLSVGAERRVRGLRAVVVASTPDGRPSEVEFHFDVILEELAWLAVEHGELVTIEPPCVGERRTFGGR